MGAVPGVRFDITGNITSAGTYLLIDQVEWAALQGTTRTNTPYTVTMLSGTTQNVTCTAGHLNTQFSAIKLS